MLPLAQALLRRGHTVNILAPPVQNPQDAGRSDSIGGVTVTHTPLPTMRGPANVMQQVLSLLRQALAAKSHVLHLFKPKGYGGLAVLLARAIRPDLPLVLDTDDWEGWGGWNDLLPCPYPAKLFFAWQEQNLPRRVATITVASRTLETLVWGLGTPPAQVFYLPNGSENIAASTPKPVSAQLTMLLYTRFWEFTVRDVVVALVAIANRCPQVRLLVIGRGERGEEQDLLRLARGAGLAAMIDYRGWVEPDDIPCLLARADLALMPLDDTLINRARCSVKMVELMAEGLPIVAGRVGEADSYIENEQSGLLVPPSDPAALAQAALRLLEDPALRQRLGAGAQARIASAYTWDRLAVTAEQAYLLALQEQV
ncbi:MAG: glycosyltransferase family 4 protein [Chloroflexales bacterium]|nr:glycosyltransferase family 4 protein [Chloroflexales bacterium]